MEKTSYQILNVGCLWGVACYAGQVMVWLRLTRAGVVLGPHFAERNLDTREYLRIIRYHVIQRDFHVHNIDRNNMWWQQDGVPAHTSNATMHYLR